MRGRKTKTNTIEKIHELIDSTSLPTHKNTSSYDDKYLDSLLERLSDEPLKNKEKGTSSGLVHTKSESLKPRVVVHKREDTRKKEERVIEIELGPRAIKKQKEHALVGCAPPMEDFFAKEPLYEIEKVAVLEEFLEVKPIEVSKKSEEEKKFIPMISIQGHNEEHLPEWEPVIKDTAEKENVIPSFEPVELEVVREERQQLEPSEVRKKEKKELIQKKLEEKQAKREAKEKERKAKRLAKEHDEKLQLERLEFKKKQQKEQRQKDLEKKKAADEAKEKDWEEQRLLKEREEKLRLEQSELRKKEKEEQKLRKLEKEKKAAVAASVVQKKSVPVETTSVGVVRIKQEEIREKPLPAQKEEQPMVFDQESLHEETHKKAVGDVPAEPEEPLAQETMRLISKEEKREQKRLEKEQNEKKQLEQLELKKKEKEEQKRKKLEEKQRAELFALKREDKEKWKQKKLEDKQARREAKEEEQETKRHAKEELKTKQRILALNELELKMKEKEKQKLKELEVKKEKERLSELGIGKAKETGFVDERKKVEEPEQKKETIGTAVEAKERRKLKAFERKIQKEREKKEKEERKLKAIEEEKAKKKMNLNYEEEIVREKLAGQAERTDAFIAFDSIDQQTAVLLCTNGYTSIEKLQQATVKDLMKIGLKKKIAQRILAESGEFVEWETYDADEYPEKKTNTPL